VFGKPLLFLRIAVDGPELPADLFELAPVPMWVFDEHNLNFLAVNRAAAEAYGYTCEQFMSMHLTDMRPPAARGEIIELLRAGIPDRYNGVYRHQRHDGSFIDVAVESQRLRYRGVQARLTVAVDITEARGVKRAHARAVDSLAETLDAIADGFFALNFEMRITVINERGAALIGQPAEQLVGRLMFDIFPDLREHPFGLAYRKTVEQQVSQHVEAYYAPKDRWYLLHTFPSEGGLAAYFSDVTLVHRAAEELRRSHEQFELAAEATNDVIWERDLRTQQMWVGASVQRVFGLARACFETDSNAWFERVHEDDRAAVQSSLSQALKSGARHWDCEYRMRRGDGSYAEVLSRAIVVVEGGIAQRLVGALQDVTQSRAYQRELREHESIVNAAPSGIVLVDASLDDMPIVFVNPAFERITGYSAAEVIGRNCRFLQGSDHDQEALQSLRETMRLRHANSVVLRNYRKDGSQFWNHLIVTPVKGPDQRVTRMVGIITDVSAQRRSEDALAFHATHDSLTGLLNRDMIEERLSQALSQAKHQAAILAVLTISLDGFKTINDSAGFSAGDQVLQHVAHALSSAVGNGDWVARVIADEYLCVCHLQAASEVEPLAARLIAAMAMPMQLNGRELRVQASLGIALNSAPDDDARELLRKANAAMLEAKAVARGSFKIHQPSMDYRIADRLALAARLREALDQGRFELHYQLQTQTDSGRIHGAEALLRLRRDDGVLASPQQFMAVAESTGLIVPIGHWVLQEACAQAMRWRAAGFEAMTISVNVSVAQFKRAGFVDEVREVLEASGLPAFCLELEITETLAMDGVEAFIETLSRLKQLGLRIALDDFGTGFSSLTYLRRFAVDTLKIDRSFVRDITTNAKDAAICRTIIVMAHNLGMTAIAEGVETTAQASYLGRNGCDRLQGFLLHRPAAPALVLQRMMSADAFFTAPLEEDPKIATVMILDDDELQALATAHVIEQAGFQTVVTTNTADAFETLALKRIDVVIADERMPDIRGSDFLLAVKDLYPESVRILQSGTLDANVIAGALNRAEIFRYISKGASNAQIAQAVKAAFESRRR
jgi:diguanylate cyclase (GGDEF)-like protein/PAS domain S-box-containing protein